MSKKKRQLTAEEKQIADRLKEIWNEKKKTLGIGSQEKLAHLMGYTTQGSVTQYLNGIIPISLEVGIKFAEQLRVLPSDINPQWGNYDAVLREKVTPSGDLSDRVANSSDSHKEAIELLLDYDAERIEAFKRFLAPMKEDNKN